MSNSLSRMSAANAPAHSRLVLIVENDLPVAQALALLVQEADDTLTVVTVPHGEAALDFVQAGHAPDLIFTGLMMPIVNGAALIQALPGVLGTTLPPIVLTSAVSSRHIKTVGADAFLAIPFTQADVEELLRRFLASPEPAP